MYHSPDAEPLDLKTLRAEQPLRRLPGRNGTKADIVVYRVGDREIAVKDYGARPLLVRHTLGRWLIRRESAAYRAAEGVAGLPEFLGRLGPYTLATEWADARPLSRLGKSGVDPLCFDRAASILARLHDRGIAMGDLHHRDVLVASDGTVWLIDLAAAFRAGPKPGPLRRWVFRRLRDLDLLALDRMRARFTGADPDAVIADGDNPSAAWHRRGRAIKRLLDLVRGRRR